jgi:hypothetical protein
MLLKVLSRQLGIDVTVWRDSNGATLRDRLNSLTIEQLNVLSEAVFDFSSAADLNAWLEQEENCAQA